MICSTLTMQHTEVLVIFLPVLHWPLKTMIVCLMPCPDNVQFCSKIVINIAFNIFFWHIFLFKIITVV